MSFASDQIVTIGHGGGLIVAATVLHLAAATGDGVGPPVAAARMGRTRRSTDNQIVQSAHRRRPIAPLLNPPKIDD